MNRHCIAVSWKGKGGRGTGREEEGREERKKNIFYIKSDN